MVLIHGGATKGAEFIASLWADARKVTQMLFRPDWSRYGKAARFKRNDRLLPTLPMVVIVFPGSSITDNLADRARGLGSLCGRLEAAHKRYPEKVPVLFTLRRKPASS